MKKRGLSDVTIKGRADRLNRLIRDEANLDDPETVETALATSDFKPVTKRTYIDAYKVYTLFGDITWKKPKCPHITKEPFLPQDEEVKQLIGGMSKRLATLLKLLEETGARIGEIALAEWTDIDFKARTIKINHPEKNSNTRTLPLSKNMIAMLKSLKMRPDNHIFNPNTKTLESNFSRKRNILTERLKNPRLRKIHFHTFRHLKGTNEYQRTRDFKHVQYVLGHKRSKKWNTSLNAHKPKRKKIS
jgi:integrase